MKLLNKLAVLAFLVGTSVFAESGLNEISELVEKINTTTNQVEKTKLLNELDKKLEQVDEKDTKNAHDIVNKNLIIPKK